MRFSRLTLRPDRWRQALALGVAVTVAGTILPLSVEAATVATYRDDFLNQSYSGSDGPDSWSSPWQEGGEADGPDDGAIEVDSDGHCHTDMCLRLGMNGPAAASVTRSFDSSGGNEITLTYDFKRHVHGAGNGTVTMTASTDGVSFDPIATYQLSVDDAAQQAASHDLSAYTGSTTWIRFELSGADDDTHMNIDNIEVVVSNVNVPSFDQDLGDRSDSEDDTVAISSGASHPLSDPLVYSATGLPPGVSIDVDTGEITGTIDFSAAASSPYDTVITVTDSDGDTDTDSFTWTVLDVNRPPTAGDRTVAVPEDDPGVTIDLLNPTFANDPDGDALTVTGLNLSGLVSGTVTDNGDGTVDYAPSPDFDTTESFTYTVDDGKGGSDTGTVTLDITPAPDSPTIQPVPDLSISEGTLATFTAVASDPDTGDTVTFSLVAGPDPVPVGADIDGVTGEFSWLTDEPDGPGTYEFEVKATDGTGRSAQTPVMITVAEANEAPILDPIAPIESAEAQSPKVTPSVSDPDLPEGTLTFTATGLPPGVTLAPATGVMSGTLGYESAGVYTVHLSVSDDGTPAKTDSISFTWTVQPTNRKPAITSAPGDMTLREGEEIESAVTASDPDGEKIIWTASGLPKGITVDATTGAIEGAPAQGSGGRTYEVVIRAHDGSGGTATTTFLIVVPATVTTTTIPSGPAVTTTSSTSTTSTTLAVAPPPPPPSEPPPAADGPMTVAQAVEAKAELVISLGTGVAVTGEVDDPKQMTLDPREGLAVSFRSAVEAIQGHLLPAAALGVAVSFLLLIGLDRDDRKRRKAVPSRA